MDVKDRRHRSLTRGRCGKECRYTSSSLDSEDCRVPTQKSYSSSETLKAYDHDSRMHYGNRVTDLVHRESDEFPRQAAMELNKDIIIPDELQQNQSSMDEQRTNFTLAELGICEPSPHRSGYCSDMGILHQGYSLSTGSDADSDTEGGMSPEHAIRLWGRGIKSRRSSGLSSRENSALTLTDSDNENKSDDENGRPASSIPFNVLCTAQCGACSVFCFLIKRCNKTIYFLLNQPCLPSLSWREIHQQPSSTQEMRREF
ncbi:PREDICTED: teneurin-2-like [Galeopterus variegatus]|uniref:Teneurin-2-like n=1 Tax=Galeopterus variegatus TaxID=482537 RepID=A0ABM0RIV2_GALVR|nr:PREDICTED: teneurin-2-like [Galeopterus variegatus]